MTGVVVIVNSSLLVIPAPGVTARAGRPVEVLGVLLGERVAGEGGPVAMESPPQDAGKRREKTPDRGQEPDARNESEVIPAGEREQGVEQRESGSRQDDDARSTGWFFWFFMDGSF